MRQFPGKGIAVMSRVHWQMVQFPGSASPIWAGRQGPVSVRSIEGGRVVSSRYICIATASSDWIVAGWMGSEGP